MQWQLSILPLTMLGLLWSQMCRGSSADRDICSDSCESERLHCAAVPDITVHWKLQKLKIYISLCPKQTFSSHFHPAVSWANVLPIGESPRISESLVSKKGTSRYKYALGRHKQAFLFIRPIYRHDRWRKLRSKWKESWKEIWEWSSYLVELLSWTKRRLRPRVIMGLQL